MKKSYEKPLCEMVVFEETDCLISILSNGDNAVTNGSWNGSEGSTQGVPNFNDW